MDAATARRRLAEAPVGHLATVTPEGRPHVVACCFVLEGENLYTAVDAKPKSTPALRRLDNIRAHPPVSVLVDHYEEDWAQLWWVRVDGTARIVDSGAERTGALGALATKYRQYREEVPPGPVIAVEITGWRSWP
ncbi:MAG TPA: TIGR03668 family PPOX class F420-dependent oxidoreductase [Acidimicrobiales bacterium]|nr:TIGR03668 family PPOX class F420-dependent oxidoreductase [Acidimicrobiales bacterium]